MMVRAIIRTTAVIVVETAAAARVFAQPSAVQENPYAESYYRLLTDRGIAADNEGLRNFLSTHIPGPTDIDRVSQNIKDLGDDVYTKRETAMQALLSRPPKNLEELDRLAAGNDPETRWRAKYVLDQLRQPGNDLLYASLIVISTRKVTGLADVVLGIAPLCQTESMQEAMGRALVATATPNNAELLQKNLKSDDPKTRKACLIALMTTIGEPAVKDLVSQLDDPSDEVRFEAADKLIPFRRAECLRTFGKLLSSELLTIRNRAIHKLRTNLNKVSLPYSGYEPPEDRAKHAAEWMKTIEANLGENPAPKSADKAMGSLRGPTQFLLQAMPQRILVLVAPDGTMSSRPGMAIGTRTRILPGSHWLTSLRTERQVIETDADGKTVWQSPVLDEHPQLAARRSDGVTLVGTEEGVLVEINQNGNITRKTHLGVIQDLRSLEGGEMLVLFYSGVIRRMDVTGRVKWESRTPERATSVTVLRDGHFLVTLDKDHRIVDFDPAGKLEILPTPFRTPSQIEPLDDERLVVVDEVGAHVADRKGALLETVVVFPVAGSKTF